MQIPCTYRGISFKNNDEFYGCLIEDEHIPENGKYEFLGEHEKGKSNTDVIQVKFVCCSMTKVPQGITKIFPNMKILNITMCKLKSLCRNELIEYRDMERLIFFGNNIERLPGDLFWNFPYLNWIEFQSNKLTQINPNILNGLHQLEHVNFSRNPNYSECFSIDSTYKPNVTLEELKNGLREKHLLMDGLEENTRLILENQNFNDNSMLCDLKNYIQNETFKDFKIEVNGREFYVHKLLLKIRSPTLAEMLQNNPDACSLELVDIPIGIFQIILNFLYTDEPPVETEVNFKLLFAATGVLKVEKLKNFAATRLLDRINAKNAFEILDLCDKYKHDELRKKAIEKINNMYSKK